jgi:plasmid stabilization system protein ParE
MSMPGPSLPVEEPKKYTVRITVRARQEMLDAYESLALRTGDEQTAREWYLKLLERIGSLATLPHRYPVRSEESPLMGLPVRRFLFNEPPGGPGYFVYYVIQEDSLDGPQVKVYHFRHARRAPMTSREGREIVQEAED